MKTFSASFTNRAFGAIAALALLSLASSFVADATDIYNVDSVVAALTRTVTVPIARAGGSFDVPASDGISAHVTYPANDACPSATMRFAGLGPAAVARVSVPGLSAAIRARETMIYEGIVSVENCATNAVTFSGFPVVRVDIPHAAAGTAYAVTFAVDGGGLAVLTPTVPPSPQDSNRVVFNFATISPAAGAVLQQGITLRLLVARK